MSAVRKAAAKLVEICGVELATWVGMAMDMPEQLYSVPGWEDLPQKARAIRGIIAHEGAVIETAFLAHQRKDSKEPVFTVSEYG